MQDSPAIPTFFEELQRYLRFGTEDAQRLRGLLPDVRPHVEPIVDAFYARLLEHEGTRAVFSGGRTQVDRLRETLRNWLLEVFVGPYDDAYFRRRQRIGEVHVAIGLDQHYVFGAMNLVRCKLVEIVNAVREDPEECSACRTALHKILDIELAIMADSYREHYVRQLQNTEAQARLAQLAALGEMAASVAHEIRNPLAGISGAIEVFARGFPEADSRREVAQEIHQQIARLKEFTEQLLVFARPISLLRRATRLSEEVAATLRILSGEPLLRDIQVLCEPEDGADRIWVDPSFLRQLLINLLLNAAQAMKGKGEVRLRWHNLPAEGGVELRVSDSGPGVPRELQEQVFSPFFTTKTRGSGLGLPLSRKIAEAHGGSLRIDPEAAGGACFVLHLPPPPLPGE